ncbi:ATP-binding protein [Actinoplanes sp. NPDC051346]|uniref:PAS domain-containing sensor histidine kinase n=1 Tax=Actinoplanes sp. NPDC051346 TaxID=3155048 RepID=UPI00343E9FB6
MSGHRAPQAAPGRDDAPGWGDPPTPGIDARALAAAVPHSIWVLSPSGEIRDANPHARARGEGSSWFSFLHADDVEAVRREAADADRAEPYEITCGLRGADGTFRRHSVRFTPVGGDGPAGLWIATATDISDGDAIRTMLETLVNEREQALAFRSVIMEDMAEGLFTVDGEGRITSMNRAAREMLGWKEQELLGLPAHAVVHASPRLDSADPGTECAFLRMGSAGLSAQTVDETFTRRDGTTFEVACSVAPKGAGRAGAVFTFRDMTEVRLAEVETRHDQKLESLGRLSAGLAHEINTPIQFVGDNTRFLADAYRDMLDLLLVYRACMEPALGEVEWSERTRRAQEAEDKADIEYLAAEIPAAVSQSLEGVERVASLVRAMKSFSYKDSTEKSYADLNEAIETTLTVARNEVKYVADVVLNLGDIPDVLCHRGDLNQVFLNLLVNAADALKDKDDRGTIRIGSQVDGDTVVISFADDGPGIPEDIQQSIFEPFFTTKEVGKGTGQGLALARAVLEQHSGSIEVRSTVGEGTEFILRLPVAGEQDASA